MSKVILTDFHHQDLLNSLKILFVNRLGYEILRPIGMDWYEKGYWNIYPSKDTAEQYLGLRQGYQPKDGTLPLNEISKFDNIYYCEDKHNGGYNKAITFENFKNIDVDIILCSIPQHIKPFKELAKMKNAKFIFQMGNYFPEVNLHEIPNLMVNSLPPTGIPAECNYVQYHQEFNTDIFKPLNLTPERQITSFINILSGNNGKIDYYSLRVSLPDFKFKSYGAQNDDGVVNTTMEIASEMNKSMFGFHTKWGGDGFGHILYNWFACGKPVIIRLTDYKGRLGEELFTDQETCIDLDQYNYQQVCDILRDMPTHKYQYMCQQAYERFKKCVDYDREEIKIREFLDKLI